MIDPSHGAVCAADGASYRIHDGGCNLRDAPGAQTAAPGEPRFRRSRFRPEDGRELAAFLNWLRVEHWTLTSLAWMSEPAVKPPVTAEELIQRDRAPGRMGTFLLRCDGAVIACVVMDERMDGDHRVAVFSDVETHPSYQRRGTFWRWLGMPLIRATCQGSYDRLEAVTWPFNRKGIPVYARFGFCRVPGPGVRMVNYLPTIARLPAMAHVPSADLLRRCRLSQDGQPQDVVIYTFDLPGRRVAVRFQTTGHALVSVDVDDTGGQE